MVGSEWSKKRNRSELTKGRHLLSTIHLENSGVPAIVLTRLYLGMRKDGLQADCKPGASRVAFWANNKFACKGA